MLFRSPIAAASAIGVGDPDFGQRLKAVVVRAPASDLDEAEIKRYARDHLPAFSVPREVEFVDELPRNAAGKVVKRDLYP